MKRVLFFLLASAICLALLTGCGQQTSDSSPAATAAPEKQYVQSKESFQASDDGRNIVGVSFLPAQFEGKLPTVVFCHGYASSYMSGQSHGIYLAEHGWAALMFDFCGGSTMSKSDGDFEMMTVDSEMADLAEILAYVRSKDYVDSDKIVLIGESQGGFVSTWYTAAHPEEIRALVLLWPAFCIPENAALFETTGVDMLGGESEAHRASAAVYYGSETETQQSISLPVLIFHGDADEIVDVKWSREASEAFPNCEYHELAGAGHGNLSAEQKSFLQETMLQFLEGLQ